MRSKFFTFFFIYFLIFSLRGVVNSVRSLATRFRLASIFSLWESFHPSYFLPPLVAILSPLLSWNARFTYFPFTSPTLSFRLDHSTFIVSLLTLLVRLGDWRAVYFLELTSVDRFSFASPVQRFVLTYRLGSSLWPGVRVDVRVGVGATVQTLSTLSSLYPGIGWSEREVWDMMGVRFRGHLDLRRLLTDYGFRGFPLRKEFPVVGFQQVRYDEISSSVIYEPLYLMQEERESRSINPWLVSVLSSSLPISLVYLSQLV